MTSLLNIPFQVVISGVDTQIAFDCTVSEGHSGNLRLTEHPVEEGADVTDHAQKEPDVLQLRGIVSNQPILLNAAENLQPIISSGTPENRVQNAYDEFTRLQDEAKLLEVDTELRDYEDMIITSIATTRDASTRNILDINLTLRKFRKATVESVDAPQPVEPVHKANRKQGRKQTKKASRETEEKGNSLLEDWAAASDKTRGAGGLL